MYCFVATVAYIIGMADGAGPQTTDSEEGTSPSHRPSNSQRSSDNQTNDTNSAACSSGTYVFLFSIAPRWKVYML